jgi:predicted ATP-dependent endonuclease of OLD family
MEMKNKELLQKHYDDSEIKTELDILLSELITRFKLYQLKLKEQVEKIQIDFDSKLEVYAINKDVNLLKDKLLEKKEKLDFIYKDRDMFKNKLNAFFSDTGKTIKLDENNSIIFNINEEESLTPYQLSSGEKQILIILLNIVLLENKPTIVLMDEPEISLHVEWQMVLIQTLLEINPNLQLIMTTHSPDIVVQGYEKYTIKLDNFNIKS